MRRLVSTKGLSKEEWLKYRKKGLTGTDAGAVCGLNPFKSAFSVYQDKISDDIDKFDNEAMRIGRDMEAYVASRFEESTGKKVKRANAIFQNEKHSILLADFDRIVVGENALLECKTVSPYSADKWSDGAIPLHYLLQCQHYLAVSDCDSIYIAALIIGKDFIIRKIERDPEVISNLITIEENFWNKNVLARVAPDPDGSRECSEAISKMYGVSDAEKTIQLVGFNDELKRREELISFISKLEQEKATIEEKIQIKMQDSGYGITEDFKVSWLQSVSKRLDIKRLKIEHPDLYEEYSKESSFRRFIVKHVAA